MPIYKLHPIDRPNPCSFQRTQPAPSKSHKAESRLLVLLWLVLVFPSLGCASLYLTTAVAYGPDGKTVAVGRGDKTVRVWDVASGEQRFVGTDKGPVWSMAYSPDGKTLATGGAFDRLAVTYSPDGKTLATGGSVQLWDVESGRALGRLVHSNAQVHTGATVYAWDVTSGQEQQPFVSKIRVLGLTVSEFAKWVKFSPDGKSMVAGLSNGTVRMWDVASRREVPALIANVEVLALIAKGAPLGVRPSVAYSPDSKSLAVCIPYDLNAGTVQIWDVATGQKTQERQLPVRCTSVAYVPEGKARVLNIPMGVFNSSGTAQIWDVASGQKVWQWDGAGAIFPAALSPDSDRVAAFFSDGALRMWDAVSGQQIWQRDGVSDVRLAAFSADGKSLVAALSSGTVRMWDVASGQEMLKTLSNR